MPMYRCACSRCEREQDYFRSVAKRHDTPACICGGKTRLVVMPTFTQPDLPGYESPTTGKWIEGRKARLEDLKRSGCRPYEGFEQERKQAMRHREHEAKKLDAKVDEMVETTWAEMPTSVRKTLTEVT